MYDSFADLKPAVHDAFRSSDVSHLRVVEFLLNRVIASSNFSPSHRELLGR
jgi:hypothetical protein